MDASFTREEQGDVPLWRGLTLTLEEWGIEDDARTPQTTKSVRPKTVLKA
jgi:hypothetical protein